MSSISTSCVSQKNKNLHDDWSASKARHVLWRLCASKKRNHPLGHATSRHLFRKGSRGFRAEVVFILVIVKVRQAEHRRNNMQKQVVLFVDAGICLNYIFNVYSCTRWFKVTFLYPSWRWQKTLKRVTFHVLYMSVFWFEMVWEEWELCMIPSKTSGVFWNPFWNTRFFARRHQRGAQRLTAARWPTIQQEQAARDVPSTVQSTSGDHRLYKI